VFDINVGELENMTHLRLQDLLGFLAIARCVPNLESLIIDDHVNVELVLQALTLLPRLRYLRIRVILNWDETSLMRLAQLLPNVEVLELHTDPQFESVFRAASPSKHIQHIAFGKYSYDQYRLSWGPLPAFLGIRSLETVGLARRMSGTRYRVPSFAGHVPLSPSLAHVGGGEYVWNNTLCRYNDSTGDLKPY